MKKLSRLSKVSLMLAVLFAIDKVLGIFRQMVISRQFQLSAELDVFNAANNVPDMLFMLISGGALALAFIPVLSEVLTKEGQKKSWDLFSNILNIAFLVTAVAAIVVAVFARPLVGSNIGVAPGFSEAQISETVSLMRLNLIATLIFSVSGLVMSGLQANQHFLLPALAPIFYDLGQIFGAVVLSPTEPMQFGLIQLPAFGMGTQGLVYGVIIGAILHLLIQIPGLIKYKFHWVPKVDIGEASTRKVFRMIWPRLISMACISLIFIGQDNFASRLEAGAISALTYGWWIMQIPETLIGTAIATAILPTLSELASSEKLGEVKEQVERAGRVMLGLTIPIAVIAGLVLMPIVQRFLSLNDVDAARVSLVTQVYLLGIVGHSLVELFVRTFYALQKPKWPMIGAIGTLVAYLAFAAISLATKNETTLALANTVAYSLQAIFLFVMLVKTLPQGPNLKPAFLKAILAALLGGGATFALMRFVPVISGSMFGAIMAFMVGIAIAAVVVRRDVAVLGRL
ncbi:MAG: lipid II flippase MurJ [Anaerolineaceae bacterium]